MVLKRLHSGIYIYIYIYIQYNRFKRVYIHFLWRKKASKVVFTSNAMHRLRNTITSVFCMGATSCLTSKASFLAAHHFLREFLRRELILS